MLKTAATANTACRAPPTSRRSPLMGLPPLSQITELNFSGSSVARGASTSAIRSAATLFLYLPSHQCLYGGTVQPLPGCIAYPCPRLSKVGRPLLHLVAREDHQLECFVSTVGAPLGPVLDPYQRSRQPVGADHVRRYNLLRSWLLILRDLLGSSEQITTGESRASSGR
jgi:hypothetical protein